MYGPDPMSRMFSWFRDRMQSCIRHRLSCLAPMESAPLVLIIKSAFEALGDPRFFRSRFDLFRHQFIIATYGNDPTE